MRAGEAFRRRLRSRARERATLRRRPVRSREAWGVEPSRGHAVLFIQVESIATTTCPAQRGSIRHAGGCHGATSKLLTALGSSEILGPVVVELGFVPFLGVPCKQEPMLPSSSTSHKDTRNAILLLLVRNASLHALTKRRSKDGGILGGNIGSHLCRCIVHMGQGEGVCTSCDDIGKH